MNQAAAYIAPVIDRIPVEAPILRQVPPPMLDVRQRQNTLRDAEGQDGGFYGVPSSPYYQDAENQIGGFYGRR